MFKKRKCGRCGEKISDSYNYCPYCRNPIKSGPEEDWGLLGRNDFINPEEIRFPTGLNALFNSLVKNLNKQMKELEKDNRKPEPPKNVKIDKKSGGISISISTSGNKPPEIKVRSFGNIPEFKEKEEQVQKKSESIKLPKAETRKFSGLPKKDPEVDRRRLSNKIIYEIRIPGVKSLKDVSISQFENSIEIKAFTNKHVFYKILPINFPINKCDLSKGILTLEMDTNE